MKFKKCETNGEPYDFKLTLECFKLQDEVIWKHKDREGV